MASAIPRQVGLSCAGKQAEHKPGSDLASKPGVGIIPLTSASCSCLDCLSWLPSMVECGLEWKMKLTLSSPGCFGLWCLSQQQDKATSVRESRLCQGPVTTARELSGSSRQMGLLPGDGAKSQCHRDAQHGRG